MLENIKIQKKNLLHIKLYIEINRTIKFNLIYTLNIKL